MKNKNINIRCSEEHLKRIKDLAEKEGCSIGDFLISRALSIPLETLPETKEYTTRKKYEIKRKKVISSFKEIEEDRINSEMASSLEVALLKSSGNSE